MMYDQSEAKEFHDQASVLLYNAGLLLKAGVHAPLFTMQGFNIAWSQLAGYFENDAMSVEFRHAVVGLVMAALHEVEQNRSMGGMGMGRGFQGMPGGMEEEEAEGETGKEPGP